MDGKVENMNDKVTDGTVLVENESPAVPQEPVSDGQKSQNMENPAVTPEESLSETAAAESLEAGKKKKMPLPVRILLGIIIFIISLVLVIAAAFAFCGFDRNDSAAFFPKKFMVYVHTDSAWHAAEPMLDLRAVETFISTPEYADVRKLVMTLRSSPLRRNKYVELAASRAVDAAIYMDGTDDSAFLACVDLSFFSLATRTARFYHSFLKVPGLSYDSGNGIFIYEKDQQKFFAASRKNLLIASNSLDLILDSLSRMHSDYTKEQLAVIKQNTGNPVRIVASSKKIADMVIKQNPMLAKVEPLIAPDSLSSVSLKVNDDEISIDVNLPLTDTGADDMIMRSVLNRNSTLPGLIARLNENVQYYTILNSVSLEELKDEVFPLMSDSVDMNSVWNTANGFSQSLFKLSLEELVFSWTGTEFAVLGIENHNDPVFVLQVKDEKQRQKVFKAIASSAIINSNDSLILDGVRLPRLELPRFLQTLLKLFDISLPAPYYLVRNGFVCFSENPEALSAIYKANGKMEKLSNNKSWLAVSKNQTPESTVSLFYDLNRSVPFFLRSNAGISKVLALYSIGRLDFCIKDFNLSIQLSAVSKERRNSKEIAGFPVALEGKTDGILELSKAYGKDKDQMIFWIENKKVLHSMEVPSMKMASIDLGERSFIVADRNDSEKKGLLWAVTTDGQINFFDSKLENVEGFPVLTGENIQLKPAVTSDGIVVAGEDGNLVFVNSKGSVKKIQLPLNGSVKSSPSVFIDERKNEIVAVYDKSFIGQLLFVINGKCAESLSVELAGIAYGSPAMAMVGGKNLYCGFITQNGEFNLMHVSKDELVKKTDSASFVLDETMTMPEGSVYNVNAVTDGKYFYVLSADAVLTRISINGEILSVRLPSMTARDGMLYAIDGNIYVSPDGNLIYGFDQNLELLLSFPLEGRGTAVFADINGDKKKDLFSLSIDNKLNAWNVR